MKPFKELLKEMRAPDVLFSVAIFWGLLAIFYLVYFRYHFIAWVVAALVVSLAAIPIKRAKNRPLWRQNLFLIMLCVVVGLCLCPTTPSRGFSADGRTCVLDELTVTASNDSVSMVSRGPIEGYRELIQPRNTYPGIEVECVNQQGVKRRLLMRMYGRSWSKLPSDQSACEYVFRRPPDWDKSFEIKRIVAVFIEPGMLCCFPQSPVAEAFSMCLAPINSLRHKIPTKLDLPFQIRKTRQFEWWPTKAEYSWIFTDNKAYVRQFKGNEHFCALEYD